MPLVNNLLMHLINKFKGTWKSYSRIRLCVLQEVNETLEVSDEVMFFSLQNTLE